MRNITAESQRLLTHTRRYILHIRLYIHTQKTHIYKQNYDRKRRHKPNTNLTQTNISTNKQLHQMSIMIKLLHRQFSSVNYDDSWVISDNYHIDRNLQNVVSCYQAKRNLIIMSLLRTDLMSFCPCRRLYMIMRFQCLLLVFLSLFYCSCLYFSSYCHYFCVCFVAAL